jgi:hypothetical protein
MKTIILIAGALATTMTVAGCLKTSGQPKTIVEQEQDAIAITECISKHWGEDWTQLVANCAAQGYAVFCDVVADIEWAIGGQASTVPASSTTPTRSTLTTTGSRTPQGDGGVVAKKSHYATQPPIARRLTFKQGL